MSNQSLPLIFVLLAWSRIFMHRAMRGLTCFARGRGLSMSQITALFQISNSGRLVVSDIGDHLGVTNAAASQMIERMVQQGLILRSENPQDRREKQLVLTDRGHQILVDSIATRQAWLERLAARLTDDEQRIVAHGLEILIEHMNQLSDEV